PARPTASQISATGRNTPTSVISRASPETGPPSGPNSQNSATSSSHAAVTAAPTTTARSRPAVRRCSHPVSSFITNRQDLVAFLPAGGDNIDAVALILADQRPRQRRAHVQQPAFQVGLLLADQ